MNLEQLRKVGYEAVDWMVRYYENLEKYPVKSQVKPGEVLAKLPASMPEEGEPFEAMFKDVDEFIVPGMTHWQSPNFYAYFTANTSLPSIIGEMLTTAMGAQCMIWETSPAAAELEERVMEWLRELIGLPADFVGSIQDTASTGSLVAMLCARERITNHVANNSGLKNQPTLRIYTSSEAHSSIEKGAKIAGLGKENVVKIPVDAQLRMDPAALEAAIAADKAAGYTPMLVVAAVGTTGTVAVDPVPALADICQAHNLWLHVDGAWAGTAWMLEEQETLRAGIDRADSVVLNPHKWMFVNFDCSAYYVRDKELLLRTFEILPEYLKTKTRGQVNDYRDWTLQLGRRFRALKLWFVMRHYGKQGLKGIIRQHIAWAEEPADQVAAVPDFEMVVPLTLNLVCFRYTPAGVEDEATLNALNERLLHAVNDTGQMYFTHTKVHGTYTLRLNVGQTYQTREHVQAAWALIQEMARSLEA